MDFENEQVVLLALGDILSVKRVPYTPLKISPCTPALGHRFESSVRQLKKVFIYLEMLAESRTSSPTPNPRNLFFGRSTDDAAIVMPMPTCICTTY